MWLAIKAETPCGASACNAGADEAVRKQKTEGHRRETLRHLYGGNMHKPKRVRVNYRLRPDVKESVEEEARLSGKTMTEVVEDAVKLYVESIATNPAE